MRKLALASALGFSLAAAGQAFGGTCPSGTIYLTGFENPPFAAHSQLVGQDVWVSPVPILSPDAAVISTDLFFSGAQSVRVAGTDLQKCGLSA